MRTSPSMHMDTGGDGLERHIRVDTAARYAHNTTVLASVHQTPPALPARASTLRTSPPIPGRDPVILRSVPPAPLREPPPPREVITLDQVRPGPRAQNDYVDSPQLAALRGMQQNKTNAHQALHTGTTKSLHIPSGTERTMGYQPSGANSPRSGSAQDLVISTQPQSSGLKKGHVLDGEEDANRQTPCQDSVICSQCGKCRCQACTQPRELPRYWLCDNKCECSVQKMVDVCSCLCCVRAYFYHCFKDADGDECSVSDDPCACCEQPHCCKRWTCLGIMSLCLPCLCLYWPLRCGLDCCTSIYNKCSHRGCHCRRDRLPGSKRLLIDSESSST